MERVKLWGPDDCRDDISRWNGKGKTRALCPTENVLWKWGRYFSPVIDKWRDDYEQICASRMLSEAFQPEGQDFQMEKQTQKMECNTLTVVKTNSVSAMMGFSLGLFLGYLFQDIPGKPWPVWDSSHRSCWIRSHRDWSASASTVLGWKPAPPHPAQTSLKVFINFIFHYY